MQHDFTLSFCASLSVGTCARVMVIILCVSVSVCLSLCCHASGYILAYVSKVRRHTVSCRLLKVWIVWTSLKMFPSGDMALSACHDDLRLGSFSTKNTPMVLDTIQSSIPLARTDDYLN